MAIEFVLQLLWGVWSALAAASVYNIWSYRPFMLREDEATARLERERYEQVALIVAIKGVSRDTDPFLDAILALDHPRYRIVFAVESQQDPALARLLGRIPLDSRTLRWQRDGPAGAGPAGAGPAGDGPFEVEVVVAGETVATAQKVHNQIAAFGRLRREDRLIAFADADMRCGANWLSRLVAPLILGTHDLTGGYRWLIPEQSSLTNHLASVINASVATLGGREVYNMLWGGSMALTREAFDRLDVPELFSGSLVDDLHLAHTARRAGAGLRIGYVRSLQVPTPVRYTWRGFLEFARRQYYIAKFYTPILFGISLFCTGVYTLGWLSASVAIAGGYQPAWLPWLLVLGLDQLRALGRRRLVASLFESADANRLRPSMLIEHLGTPLYMAVHFAIVVHALILRQITWAGITYRAHGPRDVEVSRVG